MKNISLAGGIIVDADNSILLLHRSTSTLVQRETPWGKIEDNETPESTAIRELKEELNVDVNISRLIGQKEFSENGYCMNYFWFRVEVLSGTPVINEPEKFDDLKYFSINQLVEYQEHLSPNTKNLLNCLRKNEIYL